MFVTDATIISTFFRQSRGIKGTAAVLGVSRIRVGKVITTHKKKHNIR